MDEDIPKWVKVAVESIRTPCIVNGRGGNQFALNETATSGSDCHAAQIVGGWDQQ